MKRSIIKNRKIALLVLFCMMLTGCAPDKEDREKNSVLEDVGQSAGQSGLVEKAERPVDFNEPEEGIGETDNFIEKEKHTLSPMEVQILEGDIDYDPEDTIYYKNYYDDFVRGRVMHIEYPDINIKNELEEYFLYEDDFEKWDNLVEMFFDYRTIEMTEEELKFLFYEQGYLLCLQSAEMEDQHVRFVEITEMKGLSLYPTRIMIQTWDEDYIYLQDITAPIPRKIMSFFVIDNKEPYQMVVHSSGVSREYVDEQELSFWEYRGTYWALVPMELKTDTSHAHIMGENFYPDLDRDKLFEAFYYRDGIAYRPSRQGVMTDYSTVRLGKMEVVEKNRIFRLIAVYDGGETGTVERLGSYIEFEIQ